MCLKKSLCQEQGPFIFSHVRQRLSEQLQEESEGPTIQPTDDVRISAGKRAEARTEARSRKLSKPAEHATSTHAIGAQKTKVFEAEEAQTVASTTSSSLQEPSIPTWRSVPSQAMKLGSSLSHPWSHGIMNIEEIHFSLKTKAALFGAKT